MKFTHLFDSDLSPESGWDNIQTENQNGQYFWVCDITTLKYLIDEYTHYCNVELNITIALQAYSFIRYLRVAKITFQSYR